MEKPSGYFYDKKTLENKVKGFRELTPFARHAVRDILDLIWCDERLCVKDDRGLLEYLGLSQQQWDSVKLEITGLNKKFLYKKDSYFLSPWLEIQSERNSDIIKENNDYVRSYEELDDIEDLSSLVNENEKNEHENTKMYREEDYVKCVNISDTGKSVLFQEKKRSLGTTSRANIVSNKIIDKYLK